MRHEGRMRFAQMQHKVSRKYVCREVHYGHEKSIDQRVR